MTTRRTRKREADGDSKLKTPIPTESQEQSMLFQWAELASGRYPELKLLYAVPNGSHKSIPTAMKFKREGLKAGVPDIVLPVARGGYHSLYIEMKRTKGGVLSREQLDWQIALLDAGHRVVIARGFEEARRTITDYLEAA